MKQLELSLIEQQRRHCPGVPDDEHVTDLVGRIIADLELAPPVDATVIASYQGIVAIKEEPIPWAGCLVTQEGKPEIRVRRSDGRRRKRFTIFHEVNHTFHPGFAYTPQYRCHPSTAGTSRDRVEALCDRGAAEFLFPRAYMLDDLDRVEFGFAAVMDLSERYDASIEATARRFVSLWREDALFVSLKVATKPAERDDPHAVPKLRVTSATGSGRWPFVPRHKSAPDGGPLIRALEGEVIDEVATLDGVANNPTGPVQMSARLLPYVDDNGRRHDRVLAICRKIRKPTFTSR